jgi:hypothetical protein
MKTLRIKHLIALAFLMFLTGAGVQVASAQTPDPGTTGPNAVTREEYNYGDSVFQPSGFPIAVEVRASIHYPTPLGGPYPVVVFMHGRHATCYRSSTAALRWPCRSTEQPIPSFQGYDYIAEKLASNGYIVVSVSANGINAYDNNVNDLGMQARAELIQHHLGRLTPSTRREPRPSARSSSASSISPKSARWATRAAAKASSSITSITPRSARPTRSRPCCRSRPWTSTARRQQRRARSHPALLRRRRER